jgi:hypothetical protein
MKKSNASVWLCASLGIAAALWGCGDFLNGGGDGGAGCASDAACPTGNMCHPVLRQCVTACTAGADCPSEAKTCATLNGSTKSFCQCATDALCASVTAGNVCQVSSTRQCAPKCTATSGCPANHTCETATGLCKPAAVNTDGGSDAGTVVDAGTVACQYRSCAGAQESCNLMTNTCQVKACNVGNPAPDVCTYGKYCANDNVCYDLPSATCANFNNAVYSAPVFNPGTSTGPVIYSIVDEADDDEAFCTAGNYAYTFTVYAYRTDANWPSTATAGPGFWYVRQNGSKLDATSSMRPSGFSASGKLASYKVTLCSDVTSNLGAGFYFTSGNETCTVGTVGTLRP